MGDDAITRDAATAVSEPRAQRAWLVVYVPGAQRASRVIDLPDGADVIFGRSRGSTIHVDNEKVSRTHARIRRTGDVLELEDLQSHNGTRVNGERITRPTRVHSGDEIAIGPMVASVFITSGLPSRSAVIADPEEGEARLVAEVDRSVRYRRPLTLALVRVENDTVVEAMARAMRTMDLMAHDAGDDYLLILPELSGGKAIVEIDRLLEIARRAGLAVRYSTASCPGDGTTSERLIGWLRARLRSGQTAASETAEQDAPVIVEPMMSKVYALVERVANTSTTVLILGETGVGKERVAEAIHSSSGRRERPLIKINCAALGEQLLESELFGHERGAFTGADKRKIGYIEAAHQGTLFLDEIGEMPLSVQAKLLRALENKKVVRLGGTTEISVDVRVVAATQRDLGDEIRSGRFRADLLYRIGGFTIFVPPLRDRLAEIVPLAEHFAGIAANQLGRDVPRISRRACDALEGYDWPGNVRELRNAIERALVLASGDIGLEDLPDKVRDARHRVKPPPESVRAHLYEVERAAVIDALEAENQNQTYAARRLGVSRRTLVNKMEKFGLKPPPRGGRGS
jgi:DNA-binding NtrC family response regulator